MLILHGIGVEGELYGVIMIACVKAMPASCLRYLSALLAPSRSSLGLEYQMMALLRLHRFLEPLCCLFCACDISCLLPCFSGSFRLSGGSGARRLTRLYLPIFSARPLW